MATSLYAEEYADFRHRGDTMIIDGTTVMTGAVTMTAGLNVLKMVSGPTGTTAGAVWTSGAPALTAGQMFITVTAGSTVYRIPVFLNA